MERTNCRLGQHGRSCRDQTDRNREDRGTLQQIITASQTREQRQDRAGDLTDWKLERRVEERRLLPAAPRCAVCGAAD